MANVLSIVGCISEVEVLIALYCLFVSFGMVSFISASMDEKVVAGLTGLPFMKVGEIHPITACLPGGQDLELHPIGAIPVSCI